MFFEITKGKSRGADRSRKTRSVVLFLPVPVGIPFRFLGVVVVMVLIWGWGFVMFCLIPDSKEEETGTPFFVFGGYTFLVPAYRKTPSKKRAAKLPFFLFKVTSRKQR